MAVVRGDGEGGEWASLYVLLFGHRVDGLFIRCEARCYTAGRRPRTVCHGFFVVEVILHNHKTMKGRISHRPSIHLTSHSKTK